MFAVVWTGATFDQMEQIVRNNPARTTELADALRELTTRLQANASTTGESRGGSLRILFAGPLTVYFRPDESTSAATIIRVRARFTA